MKSLAALSSTCVVCVVLLYILTLALWLMSSPSGVASLIFILPNTISSAAIGMLIYHEIRYNYD